MEKETNDTHVTDKVKREGLDKVTLYTEFETRVIFRKMAHALMSMDGRVDPSAIDAMLDISNDSDLSDASPLSPSTSPSSRSHNRNHSRSTSVSLKDRLSRTILRRKVSLFQRQSVDDLFNEEEVEEETQYSMSTMQQGRTTPHRRKRRRSFRRTESSSSNSSSLPIFQTKQAVEWLSKHGYINVNKGEKAERKPVIEVALLLQMEKMSLVEFDESACHFRPFRPRRVVLCDPYHALKAREDSATAATTITTSTLNTYKVWTNSTNTVISKEIIENQDYQDNQDIQDKLETSRAAIAALVEADPVPHIPTATLMGLGLTASELWEMNHASSYLLEILLETSPKDVGTLAKEKEDESKDTAEGKVSQKTHPGFVCAALHSGLLSRFGYTELRVVWEVEIRVLKAQYEHNIFVGNGSSRVHVVEDPRQVHGAVWLTSEGACNSEVATQDNGIDRALLRQHGGGLINHLYNVDYNSHHLFHVPITSASTYLDALFWGSGGDNGASAQLSWFHLLPPPPPSTLSISLYHPPKYRSFHNDHKDHQVGYADVSLSSLLSASHQSVRRVELRRERDDSNSGGGSSMHSSSSSSFMDIVGSLDIQLQQRVVVASGPAPTRRSASELAKTASFAPVHMSKSNPGLVRCLYGKDDVKLGLELKRLPSGGCIISNVVPNSVSANGGLVKGMSLIKIGNRQGGRDVTGLSFTSILNLLKLRPQKTYWQREKV